ncbi:relaxase/mobilization nuclease domain-containing protein [Rhizobium sp. VS19-DR104.2]|uniref:relaxase/mobilization nuclease domain-containing protein n=1 Tax=unclassified Rhizobium TaxID=2613769 RepID=UPI001CC6AFFC|nr:MULTISPECIES: relaxase/mobilization nuclease domain-containing protein [unclassified Rhizobium]MBZ5762273.1 relaxase/mobilization nuclease domain-containing protein [Rhizobium sp. VS19-DR96]MBZ5768289.1 relaxase/mobilization nuclease domain-containing protein [Rhizobium sp. VS19-DR129.2]MBZ5775839.1 relaxase/mobilization nuclease domain-containing protein [Rhizobium sp. VS19-DRK62.2]MBZ5787140.1 relaxase/mobilization nuclease domain-containing protein [Rhizobium sp. VS19-DR121]MBZ5804215.1 
MSAINRLTAKLEEIDAQYKRYDEEDLVHGRGPRRVSSSASVTGPNKTAFDEYDQRVPRGKAARGGAAGKAGRRQQSSLPMSGSATFPTGPQRAAGLAGGGQSAVIKVVSFAAGSTRVGALANYVSKDRQGGVITEDEDGVVLGQGALAAKLAGWRQGFSGRTASKDIATLRFDIHASGKSQEDVEAAIGQGLSGHHHAIRTEAIGEGVFEATIVVVAEGGSVTKADGKTAKQARFAFDARFETFIGGRVKAKLGDEAEVNVTVTGTSHGREGAVKALSRLVSAGMAVDETGKTLSSVADVKGAADSWKRDLGSRRARDAMHLVVSAKAGTDPERFRATARDLLASEFENHQYFFAVHNDRGHLHAHAVILVKGEDGQRLRPDISTFKTWRSRYAEIAQSHGINMVATRRLDTASPPPFKQGEAGLERRGAAPEHLRRKIEAKRSNTVHIPVREEGRRRVASAYQDWQSIEAEAPVTDRLAVDQHLSRLATAVNISHTAAGRAAAILPIEQRGAKMAKATAEYLTNEYNRANKVLNRALPRLDGENKVEATKIANTYLAALATQLEAVSAIENGHLVERAHDLQVREVNAAVSATEKARMIDNTATVAKRNLEADTPPGDPEAINAANLELAADASQRIAAREQAEASAITREERALRANPAAPIAADPNLPEAGEELREEQELLIDRIAAKQPAHTRVHRQ